MIMTSKNANLREIAVGDDAPIVLSHEHFFTGTFDDLARRYRWLYIGCLQSHSRVKI